MERVITQKANWLVTNLDYEISIITFAQGEADCDFFALDSKVNRVRLKLSDLKRQRELYLSLNKWLMNNPQDICISTYGREFNILHKIKDGSKKIVEFHFTYDINKLWLARTGNWFKTNIIGALKTWLTVRTAKKYDKIICLTKTDYRRWHNNKTVQIYNPVTINTSSVSDCSSKIIVAIGRMDPLKGYDMLIDCWQLLENKYPEWQLKIYGGGDSSKYSKQILDLQLKHISILGRTNNVADALCNGSIYVMSSRTEGFPLVICEAMRCGLPIVTFDCPSGPAELVTNGKNGYVVSKVGDIVSMAECISKLIENEQLRKYYGENSHKMSKKYEIDFVMKNWVSLFQDLYEN